MVEKEEGTVECPYCGQEFESDEEMTASTKEGVHRSKEHVQTDSNSSSRKKSKGKNVVEGWKKGV